MNAIGKPARMSEREEQHDLDLEGKKNMNSRFVINLQSRLKEDRRKSAKNRG